MVLEPRDQATLHREDLEPTWRHPMPLPEVREDARADRLPLDDLDVGDRALPRAHLLGDIGEAYA